jgi:ABC-type uncharacterized transport system permease subunit
MSSTSPYSGTFSIDVGREGPVISRRFWTSRKRSAFLRRLRALSVDKERERSTLGEIARRLFMTLRQVPNEDDRMSWRTRHVYTIGQKVYASKRVLSLTRPSASMSSIDASHVICIQISSGISTTNMKGRCIEYRCLQRAPEAD